ncbi:SDR family NAD(P)-dependent oxidoreductase [Pedobacter sp. ISL-68]|uniref:oxidoreductase n=1 Tax=unclassified Pedobacter TaxID=2628915 RepID=UPI001BEBA525|nr:MULTISPECIES: oxidoreductase [unclassified Pedobacter]MBT2560232.1 SDR family NAD(P)-dependent oxidoreductase [Pedobacter sp. ISL-64]MBT2589212.1 SDR family NAD(P)-dependent oxidoreductase [Pedobacter sp. ISL-68]
MWSKEDIEDQSGKTVIITGANSGIGFETAKTLYEKGAYVILACRDIVKAKSAIVEIEKQPTSGKLEAAQLDLSSLSSVSHFAQVFKEKGISLHLLINNAGIMNPPLTFTAEGFESQYGVNFFGHFALTAHLYPLLAQNIGARIVTVTSLAYTYGSIDFNNLKSEKSYDAFREYCQSKLSDLLFSLELQRRIATQGDQVLSVAAHPGVTKTELSRHMSAEELDGFSERLGPSMMVQQGALSILYAAVSPNVVGGGFYGPDADGGLRGYPASTLIEKVALDETLARKLWKSAHAASGLCLPVLLQI